MTQKRLLSFRIGIAILLFVAVGSLGATAAVDAATTQADNGTDAGQGPTAAVQFENQTMSNMTVRVARTTLSDGGFVAVYNQSGALVGVSEYLDPGVHENVTVTLSSPLEAPERDRERSRNGTGGQIRERNRTMTTTLLAITHRDTNENQAFDYVSSNGVDDYPYVDAGPVSDDAIITVEAVRAGAGGDGEGWRGGGQRGNTGRGGS